MFASVISVPVTRKASTAVRHGVAACRLHAAESSSLAVHDGSIVAAAASVRARWLKSGGESAAAGACSSSAGNAVGGRKPAASHGRPRFLVASPRFAASVTEVSSWQQGPDQNCLSSVLSAAWPKGAYAPLTQCGRLPMLPHVMAISLGELRRAQVKDDDFKTFI